MAGEFYKQNVITITELDFIWGESENTDSSITSLVSEITSHANNSPVSFYRYTGIIHLQKQCFEFDF